jgi:poly-beta-1,6-N-acetyl-D-glucosamine synthase
MIVFIVSFILLLVYCNVLLVVYFVFHVKEKKQNDHSPQTSFDIIVPHRNDAEHLNHYLNTIETLNHFTNYKWIISEDGSNSHFTNKKNVTFIHQGDISKMGKKAAIHNALKVSDKAFVLTHDADISFQSLDYLDVVQKKTSGTGTDLWIGLYQLQASGHYFLDALQLSENRVLQMMTYSFTKLDHPILCSGANLLYSKSGYEKTQPYHTNWSILSGDDLFLLQAFIKSEVLKIDSSNDAATVVKTPAKSTWHAYFTQRIRWASKTKYLDMPLLKAIGILTSAVHIITLVNWALIILAFRWEYLYIIIIKTVVELLVGFTGHLKMEKKFTIASVLLSQFYGLVLIYMLIFGIANTTKWKDRTLYN